MKIGHSILGLLGIAFLSGCAVVQHKDEIGTLMSLGKDADRQEKVLEQETDVYEGLKGKIMAGKLEAGMGAETILDAVGEPVTATRDDEKLRWSYKRGSETWMKGEAIHLFFDRNNELVGWDCARFSCPKAEVPHA